MPLGALVIFLLLVVALVLCRYCWSVSSFNGAGGLKAWVLWFDSRSYGALMCVVFAAWAAGNCGECTHLCMLVCVGTGGPAD